MSIMLDSNLGINKAEVVHYRTWAIKVNIDITVTTGLARDTECQLGTQMYLKNLSVSVFVCLCVVLFFIFLVLFLQHTAQQ